MAATWSVLRTSFFALVLVAAMPLPAAQPSQMIHGRLYEDRSNLPIEGASISLTNASGRVLDRVVRSNKNGVFFMPVEQGVYRLRIRRIGFDSVDTPILDVKPRHNVNVQYAMTPRAARLQKVEVKPRSSLERGREGMAKREPLGKGKFLYERDIREIATLPVYEILGRVEGLQTIADGSIRTTQGWGCLQFLVNRLPVTEVPDSRIPIDAQFASFYQMLPNGVDIAGVEIYRQFSEVPEEFRFDAWPASPKDRGVTPIRTQGGAIANDPTLGSIQRTDRLPPCGLINVWTKGAW